MLLVLRNLRYHPVAEHRLDGLPPVSGWLKYPMRRTPPTNPAENEENDKCDVPNPTPSGPAYLSAPLENLPGSDKYNVPRQLKRIYAIVAHPCADA
jgi:hypothetical protein